MVIECTAKANETEILSFLQTNGAIETEVQEAETGWWLGTYDKEQQLYKTEEVGY
jgi:hypothetical protein